jgi:hypothetical protein
MSALPPKADIRQRNWDIRFVPKAGIHQRELHVQGTISGPKSAEWDSSFSMVGLDDIGIKRVGAQNMIVSPNRSAAPVTG